MVDSTRPLKVCLMVCCAISKTLSADPESPDSCDMRATRIWFWCLISSCSVEYPSLWQTSGWIFDQFSLVDIIKLLRVFLYTHPSFGVCWGSCPAGTARRVNVSTIYSRWICWLFRLCWRALQQFIIPHTSLNHTWCSWALMPQSLSHLSIKLSPREPFL